MTPPRGVGRASVASVKWTSLLKCCPTLRRQKVTQREAGRDRLRYGRRDAAAGATRPAAELAVEE